MGDVTFRVVLLPRPRLSEDFSGGAVTLGEEPPNTKEEFIAMPVAEVDDRCITTGWEETITLAIDPALGEDALRIELKDFLVGSGWWTVFSEVVRPYGLEARDLELDEAVRNLRRSG